MNRYKNIKIIKLKLLIYLYWCIFFNREETLAQTTFKYNWKLNSCPRPPTHIGPSPPIRAPPYSTYTPTLQLTDGDHDETTGIDLGSDCKFYYRFK